MTLSVYDDAPRDALLRRLAQLRPGATARWGRMTAAMMVAHLLEAYRMPDGALQMPRRFVPLRPLVRWLLIYHLPFPKGAPTAPELLARVPAEWAGDLAALRDAIAGARRPSAATGLGEHPLFGPMTPDDWGALLYKHTDHHFRQFGI